MDSEIIKDFLLSEFPTTDAQQNFENSMLSFKSLITHNDSTSDILIVNAEYIGSQIRNELFTIFQKMPLSKKEWSNLRHSITKWEPRVEEEEEEEGEEEEGDKRDEKLAFFSDVQNAFLGIIPQVQYQKRLQGLWKHLADEAQIYIRHLEAASNDHKQHHNQGLINELDAIDVSKETEPLVKGPSIEGKLAIMKEGLKKLHDVTIRPYDRIQSFSDHINQHKDTLSIHRDNAGWLFLKNLSIILGSLFVGTGFFIAAFKKRSPCFWKSHGAVFVNRVGAVFTQTLDMCRSA